MDQEKVASGTEYYILFSNYIVLSAFVTTALWGFSPRAYKAAATKAATSDSFCFRFWGVAVVAMLCNTVAIIFEPVVIVKYLVVSPKWTDISNMALAFGCAKVIQLFLFLVTDFIAAVLIVKVLQKDAYFPAPALLKVTADFCCCCRYVRSNTHTAVHKLLQVVAIWNLLLFVHMVTIGVLPTILWIFILPIKMLSVISLTTAALFSLTAFMATTFSLLPLVRPPSPGPIHLTTNQARASQAHDDNNSQDKCSIVIQMLLIPQLFATVTLMFVLYLNLVTTQMDTNKPTDILASFIPTALLAVVGWVYTTGEWKSFFGNQGQPHSQGDSDSANLHSPQENPPTQDRTNESGSEDSDDQLLQP